MMIVDWIAALLSGIAGALGIGGGGILVIYLTLFGKYEQLPAQGINLLFFIPCALVAIAFHAKNKLIKWRAAAWLILGGIVGTCIGFWLTSVIGEKWVSKVFAVLLIAAGARELFQRGNGNDDVGSEENSPRHSDNRTD